MGKMQIKGVTIATSHGSPPPGTWHTEFSVENKYTYLDTRPHHEPRGGWDGENQRQSQNHKGKIAQQWHNYACLQRSSAGQQQISQLTLIIVLSLFRHSNESYYFMWFCRVLWLPYCFLTSQTISETSSVCSEGCFAG